MLVAGDCVPVGNGRQIELAVAGLIAVGHRVAVALVSSGGSLSTRLQALGAGAHPEFKVIDKPFSDCEGCRHYPERAPQTVIGWGVETAGIICGAQVLTKLAAFMAIHSTSIRVLADCSAIGNGSSSRSNYCDGRIGLEVMKKMFYNQLALCPRSCS